MIIDFSMWEWPQYTFAIGNLITLLLAGVQAYTKDNVIYFVVSLIFMIVGTFVLASGGFYS